MNEERTNTTNKSDRHDTNKPVKDCPLCNRLHTAASELVDTAKNKKGGSESYEAKQIKDRLHFDPETINAIEEIEQFNPKNGILQTWREIEELINGRK